MPVVATMTILALLRDSEESSLPFTDVRTLRHSLRAGLADEEDDVLDNALAIADELQQVVEAYQQRVESTLDTYIAESNDHYTDAAELIAQLGSLDVERDKLQGKIIDARQALHHLLTEQQWDAVFTNNT